jgi:hypothetical protein
METDDQRHYALPRFSLDRRVTVLVLLASAVVVGVVATTGIPWSSSRAATTRRR